MLYLIGVLESCSADKLPATPWVLHSTPGVMVGRVWVPPAPFVSVTDSDGFLDALRGDVAQGPGGPRADPLELDLKALVRVLFDQA